MRKEARFGAKISLPSTAQIKHELRMMMANDRIKALKAECAALEGRKSAITTKSM